MATWIQNGSTLKVIGLKQRTLCSKGHCLIGCVIENQEISRLQVTFGFITCASHYHMGIHLTSALFQFMVNLLIPSKSFYVLPYIKYTFTDYHVHTFLLKSLRPSPSIKSKPNSNPKKGKGNLASGLSLISYGPPTH